MPDTTSQWILARCRKLGFALAGMCRAEPSDYGPEFQAWLAAGKHGEMSYLAQNVDLRLDPRNMVPGAKSIICIADRYWTSESDARDRSPEIKTSSLPSGVIARYARGDDYHTVMKKRLRELCDELCEQFPDETFRSCVDTAPVLEREHAQRAGLGSVGKHTLMIDPGMGSYFFLGEIITTLELQPSETMVGHDPCGSCTRCLDACPTNAITPWSVDATKCISYLTIEHRSAIDEKYHEAFGDWIFGCDICQEVCPHNQETARSQQAAVNVAYQPRQNGFDLLEILNWDEQKRRDAFIKSAMKRAKLDMMKRNAIIAAGNHWCESRSDMVLEALNSIADDAEQSQIVCNTARVVLDTIECLEP